MSDIYPDIDDTQHTKHINIFQVRETITSKNEFNEKIHHQPQSLIHHQAHTQATNQNKANVIDKIPIAVMLLFNGKPKCTRYRGYPIKDS